MVGHTDLKEFYSTLHMMRYNFKYSSDTIESMLPWELDVEVALLINSIKKENQSKSDNF